MRRRGYNGYQGRNTVQGVLKIVLCALVVVLVLAVAGLMLGQRYIVYTDDGVRLELPFFQRDENTPVDESAPVDIVQLPGKPKPEPAPQPEADDAAVSDTQELQNEQISE